AALPLAPTARLVLVESEVPSEVEQLLVAQTSKVTLPVSWLSGSEKVAVSVGVAVFGCAASAGVTSVGAFGVALVVLLLMVALVEVLRPGEGDRDAVGGHGGGAHRGRGRVDGEGAGRGVGRGGGRAVDVLGAPVVGGAALQVVAGRHGGAAVGADGDRRAGGV